MAEMTAIFMAKLAATSIVLVSQIRKLINTGHDGAASNFLFQAVFVMAEISKI